jgi:DNA-directed RNA polymerase subunit RPC12/RpoP
MTTIGCRECGRSIRRHNSNHLRCHQCYWVAGRVAAKAHNAVARAVRAGQIPDLKASVIACTDCGARANRYDHRDYAKPLVVEPVCHSCNLKRGPAAPIGMAA